MKTKRILAMLATAILVISAIQLQPIADALDVRALTANAASPRCSHCWKEMTYSPEKAASCFEDGVKAYYYHDCTLVGRVICIDDVLYSSSNLPDTTIPARNYHTYQNENATYHKCSLCGEEEEHIFDNNSDTQHACSTCGAVYLHTIVEDKAVDATCTEAGHTAGSHCSVCKNTIEEQEVVPAKHDFQNYICSNCNTHEIETRSCGSNATYTLDRFTGELMIRGTGSVSWVFYKDLSIKTVVIEDGITNIDYNMFNNCTNLESIIIPSSVTSIGENAFNGCSSISSINIPSSVTSIGECAFYGCSSLSSINIPSSVTSIGTYAFDHCSSLTSINIPSSVTSIGSSAFYGCSSLSSINIPSSVTSIASSTFCDCSSLESINIPSSVTSIGEYAFYGCSSLSSINIPSGVTSIGEGAFSGCGIKSINIPSSVSSISDCTFLLCENLESITIPKSVTRIGTSAFCECDNLSYVFYTGTEKDWKSIIIFSNNAPLKSATLVTSNYVEGASLALDGTLKVNIKFKSGAADDLNGWTINGEAVTVVDANNCATIEVAPKDYNQNIEIKYNDVQVKLFSVADMIYNYKQADDTKAIAQKLDAYCEAAENYFAGKTVADYSSSWETVKTATSSHTVTMGDNYYGSSLVLNSGTILRHYYTAEFTGCTGTKNNMHYKDEMIPAHQYAMGSASDGTYCVNDYINRALNNSSSTPDLKNLCVALYNYGVAAKAYSNAVANGGSN